jgi:hypothetical protein
MAADNHAIEIAKLVIEAIRVLAWPVLIAVLVVAFNRPLRDIINSFSLKFSEASKFSIGSLSLEIEAKAREAGNPDLARQVGSLTAGAVEQLLRTPRTGDMILLCTFPVIGGTQEYGLEKPGVLASLEELEKKGFLRFRQPLASFVAEVCRLPVSDSDRGDSERIWYSSPFAPNSEDDKHFQNQGYALTEKGLQAVDTIVKAVAAQLTHAPT